MLLTLKRNFCLQQNLYKTISDINQNNHSNNSQQKCKQIRPHLKIKFTNQEDMQLLELVKKYGTNNWYQISKEMKSRTIRQCRERYRNYLTPEVTNGPWTKEEDDLLFELFYKYGARWKTIASFFPSRTDINIKSRWHVHFRKYIRQTKNIVKKKTSFNQNNNVFNYSNPINNYLVSSKCNAIGNNHNGTSLITRKSICNNALPIPSIYNVNDNSNECKNGIQHDEKQSSNSSKINNDEFKTPENYVEKNTKNEFDEIFDDFFETSFYDSSMSMYDTFRYFDN